jgi:hypothetical protein
MEYLVIALTIRGGGVWYYIVDQNDLGYPVWYPAPLFEVCDRRLSRYWEFGYADEGLRSGSVIFAYPEWAQDPGNYYDHLTDGEVSASRVFEHFHELMRLEYATREAQGTAVIAEGMWLICPSCHEGWESESHSEMVRCPSCRSILLNPTKDTP